MAATAGAGLGPPAATLPTDAEPPVLILLGAATITVPVFEAFVDPGAYAVDTGGGGEATVTTQGLAGLGAALFPDSLAALGPISTGSVTLHGPFVLAYTAEDAEGNRSPAALRRVFIDASCPGGARRCPDPRVCETLGLCIPGVGGAPHGAAVPYVPPVDTTPPVLSPVLAGDDELLATEDGVVVALSPAPGGATYVDAGATAVDDTDGDLSNTITSFGLKALQAAPLVPTATPPVVLYAASDAAGNAARAARRVLVRCTPPERDCAPEGVVGCSVAGVCVPRVAPPRPPAALPVMKLSGPREVFVPQGEPYAKCPAKRPVALICDHVRAFLLSAARRECCCLRKQHAAPLRTNRSVTAGRARHRQRRGRRFAAHRRVRSRLLLCRRRARGLRRRHAHARQHDAPLHVLRCRLRRHRGRGAHARGAAAVRRARGAVHNRRVHNRRDVHRRRPPRAARAQAARAAPAAARHADRARSRGPRIPGVQWRAAHSGRPLRPGHDCGGGRWHEPRRPHGARARVPSRRVHALWLQWPRVRSERCAHTCRFIQRCPSFAQVEPVQTRSAVMQVCRAAASTRRPLR